MKVHSLFKYTSLDFSLILIYLNIISETEVFKNIRFEVIYKCTFNTIFFSQGSLFTYKVIKSVAFTSFLKVRGIVNLSVLDSECRMCHIRVDVLRHRGLWDLGYSLASHSDVPTKHPSLVIGRFP